MKKYILAAIAALGLALTTPAYAEVSIKDAVTLLNESVVPLKNGQSKFCTAFKIGPKQFMTAAHCAGSITSKTKIDRDFTYQFIETVLFPIPKKADDKINDWALITTLTENSALKGLKLGCEEELYVGQRIASMGYPATVGRGQLDRAFVTGYISSLTPPDSKYLSQDIVVDMPAAPGASGSPVISLDTGAVVGILVELTTGSRDGSILTGLQHLPDTMCNMKDSANNDKSAEAPQYTDEDRLNSPF